MTRIHQHVLALALFAGVAGAAAPAAAQTVGYNVRTGDVWVDTRLGEINQYGMRYREPFVDELVGAYGAPRPLVVELLERRHWAPADVYYACAMARALRLPCLDVVREYDRAPGQGWGAVAKRLGIKPGSPAFHALKNGTLASYDRWGHPVTLSPGVHIDLTAPRGGGKGNGKPAKHGPAGGHGGPAHTSGKDRGGHGNGHGNGNGKGHGRKG